MLKTLRSECEIDLRIETDGPLLINSGQGAPSGADLTAVRTRRNGRWETYIPGSSLKGALRAQAERIARTLASEADHGCCDPFSEATQGDTALPHSCSSRLQRLKEQRQLDALPATEIYRSSCPICRLFGNLSMAGRLAFRDAHRSENAPRDPGARTLVGIDRHTGGAHPGALFELEVVEDAQFATSLYLRNFELWQLGLLAFVLRDLQQGLIRLGMGKSRGLGRVRADIAGLELRYTALDPAPAEGELCRLLGIRALHPPTADGKDDYGFREQESRPLALYSDPAPDNAVTARREDFGLRTVYRFDPEQCAHLWAKTAPCWLAYARGDRS